MQTGIESGLPGTGIVPVDMQASLMIESRYENIELAERVLVDILTEAAVGGEDEYWVITALREGIANAVRHGAKGDPEQRVEVGFCLEDRQLTITIADTGEGFSQEDISDPTDPENLLRPCGRGIFYMRRFMDSVAIDSRPGTGTLVTMSRKLTVGREKGDTP